VSGKYRCRCSARWAGALAAVSLLFVGCASHSSNGAAPSVTLNSGSSLVSTPAPSGGVTSTRSSTVPPSTGPPTTSHTGSTSPRGSPTTPRSTTPVGHGPGCSATASGTVSGRRRQAIAFPPLGTDHEWPDNKRALIACSSSGLPVAFTLTPDSSNCQLSGDGKTIIAQQVVADCVVVASQGGNGQYAPAQQVTQAYRVNSLQVTVTATGPGSQVLLAQGKQSIAVTLSAKWPFVLDWVGLVVNPDPTVCSPDPQGMSIDTGTKTSITVTFAIMLHTTGSCDIAVRPGDSEFVISTGDSEVQFSVA
jgi:hypothetical protein